MGSEVSGVHSDILLAVCSTGFFLHNGEKDSSPLITSLCIIQMKRPIVWMIRLYAQIQLLNFYPCSTNICVVTVVF
jgi:hypothetical protein